MRPGQYIPFFFKHSARKVFEYLNILLLVASVFASTAVAESDINQPGYFSNLIQTFSATSSRDLGSNGHTASATLIKKEFKRLGYKNIGTQTFITPTRTKTAATLILKQDNVSIDIDPFISNAISPDTLPENGVTGSLVYVGNGDINNFNKQEIKNAIVLMDIDSKDNWLTALSLGARALIYLYDDRPDKFLFQDKKELTPVNFPRFILSKKTASSILSQIQTNPSNAPVATLKSDVKWQKIVSDNIYCLIQGKDAVLNKELIIVEAFYDTAGFVPGKSPGADQACSISTLLDLARYFKIHPPNRSILLLATSGHANGLSGMREFIWALSSKKKHQKKMLARYITILKKSEKSLEALKKFNSDTVLNPEENLLVHENIKEMVKNNIDHLNNQLMTLRLEANPDQTRIKQLAGKRMEFKRLESSTHLSNLPGKQTQLVSNLVPQAMQRLERIIQDCQLQKKSISSAMNLRKKLKKKKKQIFVSLHLSSNGDGIGAFNQGWLYDIKPAANTFAPYVKLNQALLDSADKTATDLERPNIFKDSLRPSLHRSWDTYFKDTPALGGEVSRLGGFLGVSFVTTNDARQYWDTPFDSPDKVNFANAAKQSAFISGVISHLAASSDLNGSRLPRNGFATLTGRANFLRHGAIFADAPAPGSIILAFQGPAIFHSMVDESGLFFIKGATTKKLSLHKLILEGYKFNPQTGETIWAVDKKKTTKARYRVKMRKNRMETDLVMFACAQTTVLNLLEPRNFNFMTKLQILDARMDATPIRHWFSRLDTRKSIIASIFLPPGTRFKLALSDSLLTKKLILTHSTKKLEQGNGYRVDQTSVIAPTQFLAAKDMWALLNPRVDNLESKGINNQKIKELQIQGNTALKEAHAHFENMAYDKFFSASGNALALAGRVYDHVESIQKDVLYGVLFYILLFAPFAFCMERLIFAFINIYKRIAGFIGILLVLITIIYNVHPAFDLAYSPIVVILAFFIIGLSAIVTWIIFNHFENEMKRFQQQGKPVNEGEISLLKAFTASFFMGVNNLRRRRMRTALTCTTLIILTFTIMSFTSVKSMRQHSRLFYNNQSPYQGLLIKQINWKTLPSKAFDVIENSMSHVMTAAPRAWLETKDRTRATSIPVKSDAGQYAANAMIGLTPQEANISGLSNLMSTGRWFSNQDRYCVIIPERMADQLKLTPENEPMIELWSIPFKVIGTFNAEKFNQFKDLDGEPITPVIFPDEVFQKTTESEMEAMESGEDVKAFQSRYKHIPFDQTVIIPYQTLISLGGNLKSVALKYNTPPTDNKTAFKLVDRFGLWLFSGEKEGVFVYSASDNLNYSGLPNVMIPILISIFIVLNTMIGSVQERKREIGIYTSIGMAPTHVSIIFIAEALSYAVISVVLGYIMAQVIVKVFAGTVLLNGLTVNYSSLGGVFAMALVMGVVLLSSIYPSKVAASIAIPDVEKSWELAKAQGDELSIDLPFLIKENEALSVGGFLYELFDTHKNVSHGIFSVGSLTATPTLAAVKIKDKQPMTTQFDIRFTAWLAPFDLGIMQNVLFTVIPSDVFDDYMEIKMIITRQSGEQNTWWRVNKRFVNLIRKQLLIWRSMEEGHKERSTALMTSILNTKGQIL